MLRDRLLSYRWLVYLIVAWGVGIAAVPRLGEAAPLPPTRDGTASVDDLEAVGTLLEQRLIRERLGELGVSPAEAEAALARLSPEERREMAARVDELDAGGNGVAILAIAIIVGMIVILVLELLGRRIVSRP
jgi:hypothetical protein